VVPLAPCRFGCKNSASSCARLSDRLGAILSTVSARAEHKEILAYDESLKDFSSRGVKHETAFLSLFKEIGKVNK
jgi:hypothetical protein